MNIPDFLSQKQVDKLLDHCNNSGKSVMNFWRTNKNVYVRLRLHDSHDTEIRYWAKERIRERPKGMVTDPARWKKVG